MTTAAIRIGHGFDAHRFASSQEPGKEVFITLGGEKIRHQFALLAHSDGDVLIHALCDAILGALSLGDIGRHFPDSDEQYAGVDSRKLLTTVVSKMQSLGYRLGNADITLIAQRPKMAPHIANMLKHLSQDCLVPETAINIKATTTEKMGFTGREEGIACHAVVLLFKGNYTPCK